MSYQSRHNVRARWIVYLSLLVLRFVSCWQRGYVHPDEFFQGGSELFFGIQRRDNYNQLHSDNHTGGEDVDYITTNVPWEFEPANAVRSIVPPAFMTLLPLRMYDVAVRMGRSFNNQQYGAEIIDVTSLSSMLWAPAMENLSGREILLVPRLFLALISLMFLDGSLWMLILLSYNRKRTGSKSNSKRGESTRTPLTFSSMARDAYQYGPPTEVLVLASSWPCLVFGVRPFTNNLEAMVLAFLLAVIVWNARAVDNYQFKRGMKDIASLLLVGATCSVGIFVRFTFAFFAFPIMLIFLWHRCKMMGFKLKCIVCDILWMAFSFLSVSFAFIWVDTQYYSLQTNSTCGSSPCEEITEIQMRKMLKYIAPLNAFLYNAKSTNLAEHGLHPRITHSCEFIIHVGVCLFQVLLMSSSLITVVNMPMMYGPMAVVCYGSMIKNEMVRRSKELPSDTSYSFTKIVCQWSIISGLLVLSCAPHQEPRFLLPSIVPLVFLDGGKVAKQKHSSKTTFSWLLIIWVVFNLILYIFFGWLHQGGLVTSLLHLESSVTPFGPKAFIYYKTYMPPTFLARTQPSTREEGVCGDREGADNVDRACLGYARHQRSKLILDLQGADSSVLLEVLRKWIPCPVGDGDTSLQSKLSDTIDGRFVHLVSPPAVILPLVEECSESSATMRWEEYSILLTQDYRGHVSTEDWPSFDGFVKKFLGQLKLGLYTVSCRK